MSCYIGLTDMLVALIWINISLLVHMSGKLKLLRRTNNWFIFFNWNVLTSSTKTRSLLIFSSMTASLVVRCWIGLNRSQLASS